MVRKNHVLFGALVLIVSLLIAQSARADQVLYLDFEGFSMTHFSSGASVSNTGTNMTLVATFSLSLPAEKYLNGIMVNWTLQYIDSNGNGVYGTAYGEVKVVIASKSATTPLYSFTAGTTFSKTYESSFGFTGLYNSTFTIYVYAEAYGGESGDTVKVTINDVYAYTSNDDYAIKSKLTELKYIPPGADNTPEGFILNRTEVDLGQTYNLSEGTISFWLKWDGTTNISISDNIGIDGNGYLYVKSDNGVTYTLEGVRLPVGVYVPVYIGWQAGNGYIMVNTTKISLNWAGNLIISKIGDLNLNSATIIDEFKLWNTYIPPDLIPLASQTQEYHVLVGGNTINIAPEGGTTLGVIDVTFLGQNYTPLNTTTLSQGSSIAVAPNGTVAIALSRSGISRTYWLGNYSTITFPAEDAKLIVTHITVTPEQFDYLTVKTISGKVAARIKLQDNQGDFAAVYGAQYIFTFEKGNISRSRVYTVATSNLVFYITTSQYALQPPLDFQAYYDKNTRLVWVLFEDASGGTKWLNITLTGYQSYVPAWKIHDFENRSYGLYIMTANSTGTDYVVVKLTADINGSTQTFERTVYVGTNGATRPPFPVTLVSPAFIMLVSALLGIFVFPGTAPALMLLGGATSLGIVTILGWIPAVPGLIATLTLLGVLALIIHRGD